VEKYVDSLKTAGVTSTMRSGDFSYKSRPKYEGPGADEAVRPFCQRVSSLSWPRATSAFNTFPDSPTGPKRPRSGIGCAVVTGASDV
jgi:hypothetical protein